MGLFSKQTELTPSEKLAKIKSTFTVAHEEANLLAKEIENELQSNMVAVAEAKIAQQNIEKLKKDNDVFIANLAIFV